MFQLGRYQVTDSKKIAGMINPENTLDSMYKRNPQKITNMMVKLLAIHRGRSLENLLNKFPTHELEDDRDFYWELIGSSRRNIGLVEARYQGSVVTDADFNIGEGDSKFELVFDEMWFHEGETIVGNKNELYPVRIIAEPKPEGTSWVYKCEMFSSSDKGMPGSELVRGTRWSVDYAAVGRGLSRDVGGVRRVTPISMRGDVSTLRISHKIAGNAQNKKVAMGIPVVDKNGTKKSFPTLAMYEDWLVEQEFSTYKNRALMFGRTNRDYNGEYKNFDKSGWTIRMGSGIREQMEIANTYYYDGEFDLEMLEEILLSLSEGKLGFSERTFMLRTGERGAYGFHKAVLNSTSGWAAHMSTTGTNPPTIMKSSSELHSNSLKAGFQFVEYLAPNGVTVKIEVDDFYDDKERNKIHFPNSRGVAESYRYDIFYIGTPEQANIKKVSIKGQPEIRGYRWGFRNPFTGQTNNGYMSHDEDSAIVTKFCQLATVIFDPTRTAQIIPEVLAA